MITGFRAWRRGAVMPLAAAVLALALSAPASAQQQPSPAALAAAKELIELKGATHMFDPVVPGVIETAKNVILRTSPNLAKDLNEVAQQLRQEYAGKRSEISTLIARIYAQHFTEAEIKQALTFYKSPLGKKLIQEEPRILEQSMGQVQTWGEAFQEQVMTRIRAEMTKRGHKM
jgi:hypothetical protein